MPCSLSGHGYPAPGPPHACASAPVLSNSSTDGAGAQQSERGGLSVAPRSSSVRLLGRCTTQTWSRLSAATPAACPMSQLFGRGLGQNGSTSKTGAPAAEADAEPPLLAAEAQPASNTASTSNPLPALATPVRIIAASLSLSL